VVSAIIRAREWSARESLAILDWDAASDEERSGRSGNAGDGFVPREQRWMYVACGDNVRDDTIALMIDDESTVSIVDADRRPIVDSAKRPV